MNNNSYKSSHKYRKKTNGYKGNNKFSKENKKNNNKGNGGYGRPGPFGFKRRPIDEEQQIIANPFGFASHNRVDKEEIDEGKKTLTLPVINEEEISEKN